MNGISWPNRVAGGFSPPAPTPSHKRVRTGRFTGREFCWKLNDPVTPESYSIGKFAVTDVGDGHFSLNGTFTNFDNNVPTNTHVAHGNAEIIDSMIVVTLVNTFYVSSEEYGFSMINFQLNPSTLSGAFRTIDTAYQFSSDEITKEYGEGPLEFLPNCQ